MGGPLFREALNPRKLNVRRASGPYAEGGPMDPRPRRIYDVRLPLYQAIHRWVAQQRRVLLRAVANRASRRQTAAGRGHHARVRGGREAVPGTRDSDRESCADSDRAWSSGVSGIGRDAECHGEESVMELRDLGPDGQSALERVLGYLNFSAGTEDCQFIVSVNQLYELLERGPGRTRRGPPVTV